MIYECKTLFGQWVWLDLSKCTLITPYDDLETNIRGIQIDSVKLPLYSSDKFEEYYNNITTREYYSIIADIHGILKYRGYEKYKEAMLKIEEERLLFQSLLDEEIKLLTGSASSRIFNCIWRKCQTLDEFLSKSEQEWSAIKGVGKYTLEIIKKINKCLQNKYGKKQKQKQNK